MAEDVVTPHLAWPFRFAGSRLAVVEQDSLEDVKGCVYSYLATRAGERPLSPDFGLEDPTFTPDVDAAELAADIMEQEDRADVAVFVTDPDGTGVFDVTVTVDLME